MQGQESSGSIRDWVEEETRHIDLVASWDSLCDTYEALRFTDPLADAERLEEFKWITHQMNVFLTKARKSLLTCSDPEAMVDLLASMMTPDKMDLSSRKSLVFQRLRQQWVRTMATRAQMMVREKEEQDGWEDWSGDGPSDGTGSF